MIQTAWIIPGIYPNIVNKILIQKADPIPTVKKTPTGGRNIASIIRNRLIYLNLIKIDTLQYK
jgi:hypothetical protein